MNRIFLIDYENVAEGGLAGLFDIDCNDSAYIFYTDKSNKISFDFLEKYSSEPRGREIRFLKSATGKNALDFQLSSFLGSLIEKNGIENLEYVIISKDNGFNCLSSFWSREKPGIKIISAPSIMRVVNGAEEKSAPAHKECADKLPEENINTADESIKDEVEDAVKARPNKPRQQKAKKLTSQERSVLNTSVQQKMSGAKYEAKTISEVASFSTKTYKDGHGKKEIYTWLIKTYGRDKGLKIYNVIKPVLK